MADLFETCRDYRATIPLSFLKIYDIPTRFYEQPLNEKNRMCELRNFAQIWSQFMTLDLYV